jgi:acetoin utilization protein AcuB
MRPLQVYKFMSVCTQSVGRDQTLATAHRLMREHRIRHLPVLDGGVLVGVVTDRDLRFIETLRDVDPDKVLVEEAMTAEPYFVPPNASVKDVAAEMAKHKYGCAIVMEGPKVVGIFTTTDALHALISVLGENSKPKMARA